jgi:uncharacterized protein
MKVAARGRIPCNWTLPPIEEQQRSWEGVATRPGTLNMRDAMRYTLSLSVFFELRDVVAAEDDGADVQIAREFTPLSQAQMAALSSLATPVARQSLFFHFETRPRDIDSAHSG